MLSIKDYIAILNAIEKDTEDLNWMRIDMETGFEEVIFFK